MQRHTCPVCGYPALEVPPADFEICPCCGIEFGYDDARRSHAELRAEWIRGGCRWWDPTNPPPAGWDGAAQVAALEGGRDGD